MILLNYNFLNKTIKILDRLNQNKIKNLSQTIIKTKNKNLLAMLKLISIH